MDQWITRFSDTSVSSLQPAQSVTTEHNRKKPAKAIEKKPDPVVQNDVVEQPVKDQH